MIQGADKITGDLAINEENPCIARVGKLLRRTGLDELPQLINVFKGNMSLVGPRPTLPCQVKEYNTFQKKRLFAKPGITGWALINGRNNLSWSERVKLDIWYIEHWSLLLDATILWKTLFVVGRGEGLYNKSNFGGER